MRDEANTNIEFCHFHKYEIKHKNNVLFLHIVYNYFFHFNYSVYF